MHARLFDSRTQDGAIGWDGVTSSREIAAGRTLSAPAPVSISRPLPRTEARSVVRNELFQRAKQLPPRRAQFIAVRHRHALELSFAPGRKSHEYLPPIHPAPRTTYQSPFLEAIHQFDGAVMLDLQALCENADGRFLCGRNAFDGQQRLVLLRLEPCRARVAFAEVQVPANGISKIRQRLEINAVSAGLGHIQVRLYRIPM